MFAASKTDSASTGDYQISRSLRFNSADSAYLGRTFGTPTNANVWTFSCWIKRSALSVFSTIIGRDGTLYPIYQFNTTNTFGVYDSGSTSTAAVFRDPSAWYHLVIQRTDSTTVTVYFNGVSQLTATGQTNAFNLSGQTYTIGKNNTGEYFDGYMTEINFVDGQALTAASFGETNAQTGVWQPKAYSGSYGTNGFYLNFSDNSNTTAATLGKDYSGNGNNWTPNNFSVTAGAGNDSMVDSPTSYGVDIGTGGEVRGNYCTFNPLFKLGGTTALTWALNGNLQAKSDSNASMVVYGTMGLDPSTKFYNEFTMTNTVEAGDHVGIVTDIQAVADGGTCVAYRADGQKIVNGTVSSYGASYTDNDVIGIAVDLVNNQVTFYKNGTSQGAITGVTSATYFHRVRFNNLAGQQTEVYGNWGQRPFAYTAPSGYKALCTQNLPTPTIGATSTTLANKYFDVSTWSGTGSNISVTNSGGFQPDWVWAKCRSNAGTNNILEDAVRGVNYWLASDSTSSESGLGSPGPITAFNSNGFSGDTSISGSGRTYVGWQWKANGSGSTNTAGSITSTVSANTTSGFSIVTYTGNGIAGATIGHGLGVAPSMMFIKGRTNVDNWHVYSSALGNTGGMFLNLSNAFTTSSFFWNNTSPTSTVFTVSSGSSNNSSGVNYVAYCFAPVAGYSAFGQYTGNGSSTGPFIYTGFRPAFVLVKNTTSAGPQWWILDNKRNVYNPEDLALPPSLSLADQTIPTCLNFLSNGFQITTTNGDFNTSGSNYIYMAIAETPLKFSLAR